MGLYPNKPKSPSETQMLIFAWRSSSIENNEDIFWNQSSLKFKSYHKRITLEQNVIFNKKITEITHKTSGISEINVFIKIETRVHII